MKLNPKKLTTELKRIADTLPEQFDLAQTKVIMTGRDVHLSGLDPDGIPMDDTEFTINIPIYLEVNHKRALASAYKINGLKSVIDYVNKCYKMPILDKANT